MTQLQNDDPTSESACGNGMRLFHESHKRHFCRAFLRYSVIPAVLLLFFSFQFFVNSGETALPAIALHSKVVPGKIVDIYTYESGNPLSYRSNSFMVNTCAEYSYFYNGHIYQNRGISLPPNPDVHHLISGQTVLVTLDRNNPDKAILGYPYDEFRNALALILLTFGCIVFFSIAEVIVYKLMHPQMTTIA